MTRSGLGTRLMITMALLAPFVACGPFGRSSLPAREGIIEHGTPTNFLRCSQVSAGARGERLIGPGGGVVTVVPPSNRTSLTVPAGAVGVEHRFVLDVEAKDSVSVIIDVEDVVRQRDDALAGPLTLRIDLRRCTEQELDHPSGWWVWRMRPAVPDSSQKLAGTINSQQAIVVIDSTSKFMIAH